MIKETIRFVLSGHEGEHAGEIDRYRNGVSNLFDSREDGAWIIGILWVEREAGPDLVRRQLHPAALPIVQGRVPEQDRVTSAA